VNSIKAYEEKRKMNNYKINSTLIYKVIITCSVRSSVSRNWISLFTNGMNKRIAYNTRVRANGKNADGSYILVAMHRLCL
jgi:hypothetical protein